MQLTTIQQARNDRTRKLIIARIERERTALIEKAVLNYALIKKQSEYKAT